MPSFCCNSNAFFPAVCSISHREPFVLNLLNLQVLYDWIPDLFLSLRDIPFWGLGWLCWRLISIICSVPHSGGQSDNHESLTKSLLLLVEGTVLPCSASVLLHLATRHCSMPHVLNAHTHTLHVFCTFFFSKQLDLFCLSAELASFNPCSSRSCSRSCYT